MTVSMTGFAARRRQGAGASWLWEVRTVNGKGLDLRLRLPDWIDGLEPLVRADLSRALARGNVSLTLKVARDPAAEGAFRVNPAALEGALAALREVEAAAQRAELDLRPATAADVLSLRGVAETGAEDADTAPLRAALLADLAGLLADLAASRRAEGAALAVIVAAQVDRIDALTVAAQAEAEARRDRWAEVLRENLARALDTLPADPARVAQELALITVRADVTEKLDRLAAHVAAARALLAAAEPAGRKLDFLIRSRPRLRVRRSR